MATIKDAATAYESPQTLNIADLEKVDVNMSVEEREFTRDDDSTFKYDVVVVDDKEYRVPASVLKALKEILVENPELKFFKVRKSGQGMNTSYTVIPLG